VLEIGSRHAVIQGLRRAGYEPQLTQALNSVFQRDAAAAASFVRLILVEVDAETASAVPARLNCTAEEVVIGGRLDLRFSSDEPEWDVIVEVKIHAGYGQEWLERYCKALQPVHHAHVVAITRDVPTYGEPPRDSSPGWLGPVRWRQILPGLRTLPFADASLGSQWQILLDVLESEGSMGFTNADPKLFDAYASARRARLHVEEFLRFVRQPILQALQDVLGGDNSASLLWPKGGRLSYAKDGRIDIPLCVPAKGELRLRAGIHGFEPPMSSFHVRLEPHQRWKAKFPSMSKAAQASVGSLVAGGFDRDWMSTHLPLTPELVGSPDLETRVVEWAHAQFGTISESGILGVTLSDLRAGGPTLESEDDE
jgi:hypothetical protein